jgi:hypothetical protein
MSTNPHPDANFALIPSNGKPLGHYKMLALEQMNKRNVKALSKKKTSKQRQDKRTRNDSPNNSVYTGGIYTGLDRNQVMEYDMIIGEQMDVVYSSGVINNVFSTDPSTAPDWSSLQAEFDEFRVLAMEVHWVPRNKYDYSTLTPRPTIFSIVDHSDGVAALSSYDTAVQYESAVLHSTADEFKTRWSMSGTDEAGYIPTASPSPVGSVKYYSSYSGATGTAARVHIVRRVQFRGKL